MKNTIRCWISCILPCGALDVIRIVHSNGVLEEITNSVKAREIMKANPKHLLKKLSSSSMIVQPDELLKRGKIYFLVPFHPPSSTTKKTKTKSSSKAAIVAEKIDVSEKLSSKKRWIKGGRVGVWRPHLQSILE